MCACVHMHGSLMFLARGEHCFDLAPLLWSDKKIAYTSAVYNLTHAYSVQYSGVHHRAQLDHRRLEEAHLKYSVLKMYKRYPTYFKDKIMVASNIESVLDEVTPTFYRAFCQRYACKKCH